MYNNGIYVDCNVINNATMKSTKYYHRLDAQTHDKYFL